MFARAAARGSRIAIIDGGGALSYHRLLADARQAAAGLLGDSTDLAGARVAFMVTPGRDYARILWAIWLAGGIAVPLCTAHPAAELAYVLDDSRCSTVVADEAHAPALRELARDRACAFRAVRELLAAPAAPLPAIDGERESLIVYTSGTTKRPKGVVLRQRHLQAQVETLVAAWQWTAADNALHVLPLHHVHGLVNVLLCALWSGAKCTMLPRFDASDVWRHLSGGEVTVFMAVPTIYQKLLRAIASAPAPQREAWSAGAQRLRLMVSGSAALPVHVFRQWQEFTGHDLLERYGMTEIGMALSNPLHGTRVPGSVGVPLPGVEVRLTENSELEVRGAGVFEHYWQRPDATASAFCDGWFRTGDQAVIEDGRFRILGRSSVDILKTGGFKVSALEVEHILRAHPAIDDCAVVGLPDEEWGQRVAAVVVVNQPTEAPTLRAWALQQLARYKAPSRWLIVDELPRNSLGKVLKVEAAKLFTTPDSA